MNYTRSIEQYIGHFPTGLRGAGPGDAVTQKVDVVIDDWIAPEWSTLDTPVAQFDDLAAMPDAANETTDHDAPASDAIIAIDIPLGDTPNSDFFFGGETADTLYGTADGDWLDGYGGDDKLFGEG